MTYTKSERYQRCQAIFDRTYPDFKDAGTRYHEWIQEAIQPHSRLLDIGCGRMSLADEAIRQARQSVGIDLVHSDLVHNETVHYKALANADTLPFPTSSFDILTSQWVVEHFENPQKSFREMARVLVSGGEFIFLTTNANNYIPLVSRLIPDTLQKTLIHRLLKRPIHESFPTFFRANTKKQIAKLAQQTEFTIEAIDYVANPFYFAFNVPLFRGAMLFEKITDWRRLNSLKLYLLVRMRKI